MAEKRWSEGKDEPSASQKPQWPSKRQEWDECGVRLPSPHSSGQARVILDGRHVYLGPYDSPESRAKYQEIVRRHLADRTKAELARSVEFHTDITVAELVVRYLVHLESYYVKDGKRSSQVLLVKRAIRVLRERFGTLEAIQFGPRGLKACREEFVKLGWCRKEVNRGQRRIVQFFKWATSEELVPASVWQGLRSVPGLRKGRSEAPEREPVGPVPQAHVEAILPHLPQPWPR